VHRAVHGNITGAPLTYSTSKLKHATAGTYHPHMSGVCLPQRTPQTKPIVPFFDCSSTWDMVGLGSEKRSKATLPLMRADG